MTSMSEAVTIVRRAENLIVGGFGMLHNVTPALVALHTKAWEYTGTPSAEAVERGRKIRAHEQAIRELIDQIGQRFRELDKATNAVAEAIDETDAKRKTQRSKLKI